MFFNKFLIIVEVDFRIFYKIIIKMGIIKIIVGLNIEIIIRLNIEIGF